MAEKWARSKKDVGISGSSVRASLRGAYLTIAGTLAREPKGDFLHCLYLHGVYDDQVENFRSLLDALLDIGRFIGTSEVFDILEDRAKLNGRLFHLSFDDGFDNNYRNAFPSLSERGIHAAFFVPSTLVGASDSFVLEHWWAPEQSPTRFMTWSQVRELSDCGHEIASHTRTHKRLRSEDQRPDQLRDQIRGSKQEIEDQLGSACRYIAWPFGTARDIDDAAHREIIAAGYDGGFSAVRGSASPETSRYSVLRHHFEADWSWPHGALFRARKWRHKLMRIVVITASRHGTASRCLPSLVAHREIDVALVIRTERQYRTRGRKLRRDLYPTLAPALILVGVFMMASVGDIAWSEPHQAIPAFLTVIMMPLTTSITEGIAFGCISTSVLYLMSGRARELHWAAHLIAALFLARFIWF